jgi:signal transduction histidine kinase
VTEEEKTIHLESRRLITSINTSVLMNDRGEIDSAFAVIKDLTEKHALEENLRRQEKLTAMGQLASGVAHEIRNPLNAIGMISQRLDKEFEPNQDSEEFHELTRIISAESRRIDAIIQQFLKFARPAQLNLEKTNLNELIESTVALLKSQADQLHIGISAHLQLLPSTLLDRNQMKQALLNLIRNSLEAIAGKGSIDIRSALTELKNEILIEINDTGMGIDPETLPKIFNLYFTTKAKGTGLGLSLVNQIISQHNGRIEVESAVGKGTTFYVYLPV